MPRYSYECEKCGKTFDVVHSIKEKYFDCIQCDEKCDKTGTLKRLLSHPIAFKNKKRTNTGQKTGQVVKEFIMNTKEEIRKEKEILTKTEYKP